MALNVAVLREQANGERRVALDPASAKKLASKGIDVNIEKGAGDAAGFTDEQYADAKIVDSRQALCAGADIILWVQLPDGETLGWFTEDCVAVGMVFPHRHPAEIDALRRGKVSSLAMELVPRISRAQSMDVLSSQATIAGYQAVLRAATLAPRLFPMLTTAAGTLRPASVVVIGAGVAGLQAIATARRLGARVEAYDIRAAAREQVESLGAKMIDTGVNAEGEGGYARELTDEEKRQQADVLAQHIAAADVVVSTASVPGKTAPQIISTEMVEAMKPGAVIVDLAAESGGNCQLTEPGETVKHHGVTIDGPLNLASRAPIHASEMYARNILSLLELVIDGEQLHIDRDDEVIAGCLLTHGGEIVHARTAELLTPAEPGA